MQLRYIFSCLFSILRLSFVVIMISCFFLKNKKENKIIHPGESYTSHYMCREIHAFNLQMRKAEEPVKDTRKAIVVVHKTVNCT